MVHNTIYYLLTFLIILQLLSINIPEVGGDHKNPLNQKLIITIFTLKVPHLYNDMAVDVSALFPMDKYWPLNYTKYFEEISLTFDDMYSPVYSHRALLTIYFKSHHINTNFSQKIKSFFENYTPFKFTKYKIYKDKAKIIYYDISSEIDSKIKSAIAQLYNRTASYSYSHIFTKNYLQKLNVSLNKDGAFGYFYSYYIDYSGHLWAEIEFSTSSFERYHDGAHTYDLLKILNLTSLPPGDVVIEGNAMQTYKHTDFYFKSLKTNVPYTVENTTYYNITKAFEVHIDATTNITQLVITFETKENYNWEDFLTDYGGFIICGSLLLVPVAIVAILLNIRRKRMIKNEK